MDRGGGGGGQKGHVPPPRHIGYDPFIFIVLYAFVIGHAHRYEVMTFSACQPKTMLPFSGKNKKSEEKKSG